MEEFRIHGLTPNSLLAQLKTHEAQNAGKIDPSFSETLIEAIREVNQIQLEAGEAISNYFKGENKDLHQTMISMERASVSFEMMMQVRNKIVSAYEEIKRMTI